MKRDLVGYFRTNLSVTKLVLQAETCLVWFPALMQSHLSDLKENELVLGWKEWLCLCVSV